MFVKEIVKEKKNCCNVFDSLRLSTISDLSRNDLSILSKIYAPAKSSYDNAKFIL